MAVKVNKIESIDNIACIAVLATKESVFDASFLSEKEYEYVKQKIEKKRQFHHHQPVYPSGFYHHPRQSETCQYYT